MDYLSLTSAGVQTLFAVFIIPAFGVTLLIALARGLGFSAQAQFAGPEAAAAAARDALPGFHPADTVLGADRRAALVRSADGRIAVIRAHGDRWVVRIAGGAQVKLVGDTLGLRFAEPMFAPVLLDLGADAPRWAARLAV